MKKYLYLMAYIITLLACNKEKGFEEITFLGDEAQFTESGLEYIFLKEGNGPKAELGNEITAKCILWVGDSNVVWETTDEEPFNFVYTSSGLIDGFIEAIGMMKQGDLLKVIIPPDLGYGSKESELIPANAYLSYEIELLKVDDPKLWIADTLLVAFQSGGSAQGFALYQKMKLDTIKYNLNERQLGVLGTKLKRDGRLNDHFEVAKLRVQEFPDSFGAHLNLASIYIERGEKSQARIEFERCLEIDPDNPTVLRRMEEL